MEVYEITLGVTTMIAKNEQEALVGLAKALPGMKPDNKYTIVIKKVEVNAEWWDRVVRNTPWPNWEINEERDKEAITGQLLKAVRS